MLEGHMHSTIAQDTSNLSLYREQEAQKRQLWVLVDREDAT